MIKFIASFWVGILDEDLKDDDLQIIEELFVWWRTFVLNMPKCVAFVNSRSGANE